ncbi:unnamed protein product [Acanthoscelides obtectus]|uniref:Uncharacterized protein n=2 Tax=Acanthoscelides obtectus TaxID=200917 RepID=A0A9P0LP64_ACAOB|nr:unnamed protein product [Acanthoscelides obtectus]CAK1638425.1 hypothetical protein AOBTE_LOCUS10597 [Acanthoscelides obtectus]
MIPQHIQEEAKLDAMQRVWQTNRRGASSSSTAFFEEVNQTEDILTLPLQAPRANNGPCVPPPHVSSCEVDSESELWEIQEPLASPKPILHISTPEKGPLKLDASSLGDMPAQYTVCHLEPHQMPVVGVYCDKRVVPGFKYRVRPLPEVGKPSDSHKCLFNEKAQVLKSIGRGYARRFTFENDHFWSDNRPEGYAFELELVSEGDKFTFFDTNNEPYGTVEIIKLEGPQLEISSSITKNGVEKRASVKFTGKVEYYETGVGKLLPVSGTAVAFKAKGQAQAGVVKVTNVYIKKKRYHLLPGMQKRHRRVTVRGTEINDVPTKYTMTGLEPCELPVVGTYVDPRILPGFYYRVRPNDRRERLFGGRALRLLSIGCGYAKRLTFEPDSLLNPDNHLWSDSHPDGLGLEPSAVRKGMKFDFCAGETVLGEATVFRDDKPQIEERMERIETPKGFAIQKYIHIDVICHIRLARTGGKTTENDDYLMRVSGLAIVRKEPKSSQSYVVRVENVGFDSQLLLLFAQTHTELTFIPKKH